MKNLFRANIVIAVCFLATACSQALQVTSSPVPPKPTATTIPLTATPVPSQTATATMEVTPRPEYVPPTLIPTIDPALLPDLLNKALTIQALDMNGYKARRITGWNYGFGAVAWYVYCPSYVWLDTGHLLLYPKAGQVTQPIQGEMRVVDAIPQSIVINLSSESAWLPPVDTSSGRICNRVYWSQKLGILITSETHDNIPTVSTYTYDGYKLASYTGTLLEVSPSGAKIILTDYKSIDLQTNKIIGLNWKPEEYWDIYWSSDETRIYRCCYFYADLAKGISHRFSTFDYLDRQGNQFNYEGLTLYRGQWVLDGKYVLAWWQPVDDGDIKYLPMFDPATKVLYDVRELAGIPDDFTSLYTPVSPDGNYVWMEGWNESYLVNLTTFESQHYTYTNPYSYPDTDWSSDSKFTWFEIRDPDAKSTEVKILSVSDMRLHPLPIIPRYESDHLWHPTGTIIVYPSKDKNAMIFLDASTMSYRELPFKDQNSQYIISNLAWSPNGDKLVFITENHVLWQVDFPSLENLEQIMASSNTINGAQWSPDGKSIAFINGSDIYIVDTIK